MADQPVVLVQRAEHVRDALQRFGPEATLVVTGPGAFWAAHTRGVPFTELRDLGSIDELNDVCRDVHTGLDSMCRRLDEHARDCFPVLDRYDVDPFRFARSGLTIAFDTLAARVFWLRRVQARAADEVHVYASPPGRARGYDDLLFDLSEELWGAVAACPGWPSPFSLLALGGERDGIPAQQRPRATDVVARWARRSLFAAIAVRGRSLGISSVIDPRTFRPDLLVAGTQSEWAAILHDLRLDGWTPGIVVESRYESRRSANRPGPLGGLDLEALAIDGVDCSSLLRPRIERLWSRLPQLERAATRFARRLRRGRVRAFVRGSSDTMIAHTLNQVARAGGVPVLAWQHGMVAPCDDGITQLRDHADGATADYVLAWGGGPAAAYRRTVRPVTTVVVAGSPTLERLRTLEPQPVSQSRPRLLYVTTNYIGNDWYFGYRPGPDDVLACREQHMIVSLLDELVVSNGASATVKLHPALEYEQPPWVAGTRREGRVRIVTDEQPFVDLLRDCDAIVVDFPSTTLLQSLVVRRPVFVLLRAWRFPVDDEDDLRRAAFATGDVHELCRAVRAFATGDSTTDRAGDPEFLRNYGTADGARSVRSAVELLRSIRAMVPDQRTS